MPKPRKAWRTTWAGITSIVAARSRGTARSTTVHSARDAGYSDCSIQKVRAVRAPEYDRWAEAERSERCMIEEYVKIGLAALTSDRNVAKAEVQP